MEQRAKNRVKMSSTHHQKGPFQKRSAFLICLALLVIGFGTFVFGLMGGHPERAWQAYLINFLLWSAIAQGGLLFSVVMHTVKARWSGPLSNLAESFVAFFPISFILFLILIFGKNHIFPWIHQDLHGKEIWLNVPFLFTRDIVGLLVLYGLGFAYLFNSLRLKLDRSVSHGLIRKYLYSRWDRSLSDVGRCRDRMTIFGVLYILAFALILSLIGYDLVMSLDNVIAVAAAAKGSLTLLILGLAISIPLVIFGSTMLLKLMDRWPIIITIGAGLLGWVAGEMAVTDPSIKAWVDANAAILHWAGPAVGAVGVIAAGKWLAARAARHVPAVDLAAEEQQTK